MALTRANAAARRWKAPRPADRAEQSRAPAADSSRRAGGGAEGRRAVAPTRPARRRSSDRAGAMPNPTAGRSSLTNDVAVGRSDRRSRAAAVSCRSRMPSTPRIPRADPRECRSPAKIDIHLSTATTPPLIRLIVLARDADLARALRMHVATNYQRVRSGSSRQMPWPSTSARAVDAAERPTNRGARRLLEGL